MEEHKLSFRDLVIDLVEGRRTLEDMLASLSPEDRREIIRRVFKTGRDLIDLVSRDNDLHEKQRVYQFITRFLQDKIGGTPQACLAVAYSLCGESEPSLLVNLRSATATTYAEAKRLEAAAREIIAAIKVHYYWRNQRSYIRCCEIWFMKDGRPASMKGEHLLDWDQLPSDVREERLANGTNAVSFKLYPKEA
jgi:transposase-like protein